jgi:hypothetical protein
MKIARYFPIAMLGLFVAMTGASADPSVSDQTDNPYLQTDPDGIPLSISQPKPKQLSQGEIKAIGEAQKRAALNKDWLMRGYEQQLHARTAGDPAEDPNANLYYELSSNKDLAKLAGLPALDLDPDGPDRTASSRTGATPSDQGSVTLPPDASSAATSGSLSHGNLFKPLITPLSAPEVAGLHNFYSLQLPVSTASPLVENLPQPSAPKADQSQDSSDIETPGMVAAKANPLMNTGTSDLSLDVLPEESPEQAKAREESNNDLELPLPMDANQFHKEQTTTLSAPSARNVVQTAAPASAPVKPVLIEDPNAPLPVSKAPQINPVRAPIANPFDILDR